MSIAQRAVTISLGTCIVSASIAAVLGFVLGAGLPPRQPALYYSMQTDLGILCVASTEGGVTCLEWTEEGEDALERSFATRWDTLVPYAWLAGAHAKVDTLERDLRAVQRHYLQELRRP